MFLQALHFVYVAEIKSILLINNQFCPHHAAEAPVNPPSAPTSPTHLSAEDEEGEQQFVDGS